MVNNVRPPTPWEVREEILSYRELFIIEVSKGKKSTWRELSFIEKIKVDLKCKAYYEKKNRFIIH